jgi:hypothetical protein
MPLLRFALGDYAEAEAQCECGRGLPMLKRILGRSRNMLRLASGKIFWPSILGHEFREVAPVRQFQLVQWTLDDLELRLVVERPLTSGEEPDLRALEVWPSVQCDPQPSRRTYTNSGWKIRRLPLGAGGPDAMAALRTIKLKRKVLVTAAFYSIPIRRAEKTGLSGGNWLIWSR